MKILFAAQFNTPSGYQQIAEGFASRWTELGHEVKLLGMQYDRSQHDYKFSLVPIEYSFLSQALVTLKQVWTPDYVIVLTDVNKIISLFDNIMKYQADFFNDAAQAAIFPIESYPVSRQIVTGMLRSPAFRFTFTKSAGAALNAAKVTTSVVDPGVHQFFLDKRIKLNKVINADWEYILTVADNQHRKNLPRGLEAFATYIKRNPESKIKYIVITRLGALQGWNLQEIAENLEIPKERRIFIDSAFVDRAALRSFYEYARCLVIPSLAEGIGMPLYEAMALGCPVVATDHPNIRDALDRDPQSITAKARLPLLPYPLNNMNFYDVDADEMAIAIEHVLSEDCRGSATIPSWNLAADQVIQTLTSAKDEITNVVKAEIQKARDAKEHVTSIVSDGTDSGYSDASLRFTGILEANDSVIADV